MRRGIWIMLGLTAGVLFLAVLLQRTGGTSPVKRVHQHREQPSEEALGPCARCGGKGELCTHLPVITIETGGQTIPGRPFAGPDGKTAGYLTGDNGETDIPVRFASMSEEGVWHHPDDPPTHEGTALFRYRGNSSRWFSKGSYRLKLVRDDNAERSRDLELLGMAPGSEWALYGPFLDKTLLRNYMWMNLSAEVMGSWTPNVRFCELMLDGAYQGVYVLMETIDVDEYRLALTEYKSGDPVCSYLVRIEPNTTQEKELDNFTNYTYRMEPGRRMELLYPGLRDQSEQVRDYVQTDLSEVERLLCSAEMLDSSQTWRRELDVDSFVNYYILMEFLAINDSFAASTYFFRDVRGRISIGPVWDYNNALDNFFTSIPSDEFLLPQRGWYAELFQDRDFVEQVIRRYRELRRGVLSRESLEAYVEEVEVWLGSAVERNFAIWGYSFDPWQVTSQERKRPYPGGTETLEELNPSSYEEAVEWMLDFMRDRGRWMDRNIESLRQFCHPSKYANQALH